MDILLAVGSVLGVAAALAIDWYEDEFIWCGDDAE